MHISNMITNISLNQKSYLFARNVLLLVSENHFGKEYELNLRIDVN